MTVSAKSASRGEPMDAWTELEEITPLNRGKAEVIVVRLAACRALKMCELAEEIARTLIRREPSNVMHVVALAEVMGKREGPVGICLATQRIATQK